LDARTPKVFLVEDDEAVRDSVRVLLESCGHEVHDYPSGEAFLADPGGGGAGCLITDMHMPGMSGLELIGATRSRSPCLPVIVITGRADARLIDRLRGAGAAAVFEKPVDDGALLQAIQDAVAPRASA
jgi:two-component system response regulator FixJ